MSSNTENTEGKLAAYIDGRLDPVERAQIEQYLAANPEHQRLLAEMIAHRDALRALPRDKAPADIYDAIQAQLERSILLDDSAHAAAAPVRHSRRSQLFAVAAIVTLAVGLGGVLFFVLPASNPSPTEVAVVPAPEAYADSDGVSTAPVERELEMAAVPDGGRLGEGRFDRSAGTAELRRARDTAGDGIAAAQPADSLNLGVMSNAAQISPTLEVLADAKDLNDLAERLPAVAGPTTQDRLVVLVSAKDPAQASQQVATYLAANNIRWEAVHAPTEANAVALHKQGTEQLFARRVGEMHEEPPAAAADAPARESITLAPATTIAAPPAAAAASPGTSGAALDSAAERSENTASVTTAAPEPQDTSHFATAPDKRMAAATEPPDASGQIDPDATSAEAPSAPKQAAKEYFGALARSQSEIQLQQQQLSQSAGRLIIARGMTPQQAVRLKDSLSTDDGGASQRARLLIESPSRKITPAYAFSDHDAGLKVARQVVPQTQPFGGAAAAAPVGDVTTADSLGVELKKAESTTTPATQPARVLDSGVMLSKAATPQPDDGVPPSTAPALATTADAEAIMDVVILVEGESVVPATTAPATSPATTQDASPTPAEAHSF